jgi:hypothetical protein
MIDWLNRAAKKKLSSLEGFIRCLEPADKRPRLAIAWKFQYTEFLLIIKGFFASAAAKCRAHQLAARLPASAPCSGLGTLSLLI